MLQGSGKLPVRQMLPVTVRLVTRGQHVLQYEGETGTSGGIGGATAETAGSSCHVDHNVEVSTTQDHEMELHYIMSPHSFHKLRSRVGETRGIWGASEARKHVRLVSKGWRIRVKDDWSYFASFMQWYQVFQLLTGS